MDEDEFKTEKKKDIQSVIHVMHSMLERNKSIEDMNLRCYMMLDKVALMADLVTSPSVMADVSKKYRNALNNQTKLFQEEIILLMNWLISERGNNELVDPAPETERRRRNRD